MNITQETSMRVALAKVDLFFPYCHSLKEKRHILHKIKDRIFSDFKISIREVDHHDKWQRAQLGLAMVGNDAVVLSGLVEQVLNKISEYGLAEVIDSVSEIVSY